jgi:hypothetical protein
MIRFPSIVPSRIASMHMDVVPANGSKWVGPPEFSANRGYILFGYRRSISTFIDFVYHRFITGNMAGC